MLLLLGLLLVCHLEHVKSVQSEQVLLKTGLHLGFVVGSLRMFSWFRFHSGQTTFCLLFTTAKQAVDCERLLPLGGVQGKLGRRRRGKGGRMIWRRKGSKVRGRGKGKDGEGRWEEGGSRGEKRWRRRRSHHWWMVVVMVVHIRASSWYKTSQVVQSLQFLF